MFAQVYILIAWVFLLSVRGSLIIGVRPFPPLTLCVEGAQAGVYDNTFTGLEIEILG